MILSRATGWRNVHRKDRTATEAVSNLVAEHIAELNKRAADAVLF
jgi:hypothetical protein